MCIHVDDYSDFHGTYRESEFKEVYIYLSEWIVYHLVPYWNKNEKRKIDNLLDKKIKILFLTDYYVSFLKEINDQRMEGMTSETAADLMIANKFDLADYDLIINCSDPSFVTGRYGIEDRIKDGSLKLDQDTYYLSFKSQKFLNDNVEDKFFNQHLIQSYSKIPNDIDPMILKPFNASSQEIRIQYGPWPIDYLDWKNFTPWKKVERKAVKNET